MWWSPVKILLAFTATIRVISTQWSPVKGGRRFFKSGFVD
jgi:hypothetical protein